MNQLNGAEVLVTGGAGFIGSELVRQLAEHGSHVIVVDNLVNGKRENVVGLPQDRVQLEVSDIRDTAKMQRLLKGVDAVFHLACLGVRHSIHAPEENHSVNATGTLTLLAAALAAKVSRFVNVSSSEVYGTARWVPMTEEHPTYPHTVYGGSKLAGECYTRAYHDTYGFPTTVIRPFNTYGPRCHHEGDSGEVIPKFMLRAMAGRPMMIFGDGTQKRDFTFVSDTAAGIIRAGLDPRAIGQTINLGSGAEIEVNALANEIAQVVGNPRATIEHVKSRPGDVLRLCAEIAKARELCGYQPVVSFREGLNRLKEWYQSQGVSPEVLLENESVFNWETPANTPVSV